MIYLVRTHDLSLRKLKVINLNITVSLNVDAAWDLLQEAWLDALAFATASLQSSGQWCQMTTLLACTSLL